MLEGAEAQFVKGYGEGCTCLNFQVLGGSGVVISRVISPLIWVISIVTLLIILLITTHEPPSRVRRIRSAPAHTFYSSGLEAFGSGA